MNINPLVTYYNIKEYKSEILKENKVKSGIYRWVNIINGKSYIGSSKDIIIRLRQSFNIVYLENEIKNNDSYICRSLIKNGYSKFRLEILECCELDILIEKEQYYIDILNLEYNICKLAGSCLGRIASFETRRKIS